MPLLAASPLIHQKRMAMLQVLHHLQVQVADWHSSHVPGRRSHLWWRPQEESLRNWAAAPETSNCSVYSGCLHHKTPPKKKNNVSFSKINVSTCNQPRYHRTISSPWPGGVLWHKLSIWFAWSIGCCGEGPGVWLPSPGGHNTTNPRV